MLNMHFASERARDRWVFWEFCFCGWNVWGLEIKGVYLSGSWDLKERRFGGFESFLEKEEGEDEDLDIVFSLCVCEGFRINRVMKKRKNRGRGVWNCEERRRI